MDEEARLAIKHRELISRVISEVEKILLKEELNMGDFMEVVGVFVERSNQVFAKIKIKTIKNDYGLL